MRGLKVTWVSGRFLLKKHFKYLRYVLRHKWFVFLECVKMAYDMRAPMLIWRGVMHDISKFLPSEFFPYSNHFYGEGKSIKSGRDETGYYKPTDTGDAKFDFAWLLHQKRNSHHWQWWVLPKDNGGMKVMKMGVIDILEMVCDWKGAGRAQGTPDTLAWYRKNKDKMMLDDSVRLVVEFLIHYIV